MQSYLRDVHSVSLLDSEEEQRLVRCLEEDRLKEDDKKGWEARDRIVLANLRLVVHIARKYARPGRVLGLELLDLIQEGTLGLFEAIENFASGHGRFSTYAVPWIRQKVRRALAAQGRAFRIPVRVHAKLDRLYWEEGRFFAKNGRPPTPEELAAEIGIDAESLADLRRAEQEVISLSQTVSGDEEESVFGNLIEDPRGTAFAQQAADRQWLAWLLDGLSERSRRVLQGRFGDDLTLDEIGVRENVSRERIRQIESAALEKLRQAPRG